MGDTMKHYYYLHTNGDLIHKPTIVVESDPQYFDSDFVKAYWLVDDENRYDAWNLVITALAKGARLDRIKELVDKWGLTKEDMQGYILGTPNPTNEEKYGVDLFMEKILGTTTIVYVDELILKETQQKESEG